MRARVQWRYAVIGLGFTALAGVRFAQGAPLWGVVFLVAAVVNAWLAVHEGPQVAMIDVERVDRSEVDRSLGGHRASARQWQVLGSAAVLIGGGLLLVEPALAVFAGAAALFALHRARRASRAVATLQRVRVVGR